MNEQPEDVQPITEAVQRDAAAQPGEKAEPLSARLKRRGLLTGLAALGAAALVKLSGAEKAEAIDPNDVVLGSNNAATITTTIRDVASANSSPAILALRSTNGGILFVSTPGVKAGLYGYSDVTPRPIAVFGDARGTDSVGVVGNGTTGVEGQGGAAGATGMGVRGVNIGNGTGVKGVSNNAGSLLSDGDGSGIGVHGRSTSGFGVKGEGIGATGIGVGGFTAGSGDGVFGAAATGYGVHGQSSTGFGMYGLSLGNTPGGSAGVFGGAETAIGVEGYSGTTAAVHGFSSGAAGTGIGVYGFSTQHLGVLAESNNFIGLYAVSKTAFNPAVYGFSSFVGPGRMAGRFDGDVVVNGNFTVAGGAKAAAVTLPDGSVRMMYCQESPEPYFEDFGGGVLTGGTSRVNLEPAFASLVRLDGYRVFLTAEGDSRGLYVSAKDPTGFDVREQQGGQSNVGFSYRVVAKRKDIPGDRLAPVSPQAAKAIPVPPTLPKVEIAPQQVPNITSAQPVAPGANGPQTPPTTPFGPAGPKGR